MMLVDSHCHLDFADFHDDLDEVVARARASGVGAMQTIGTRLSTFASVRAIARRYDGVYCSVGVHPHNAGDEPVAPAALVEAARHPEVIGIGETGLDYHYEHSPRAAQQQSFRAHIAAARETGLPLIVHTRDADEDTVAILKDEARGLAGLVHCFSAGPGVAEAALELGLMISLSGIVTFRNADGLRAIVRTLPRDRILVETDAPYLAPVPERGKRNEPAFVTHVAAAVADLLGMDADALAAETTRTFFALFGKAAPPAGV
jgi:TatD DNase family protein